MKIASWVIRNKLTGESMFETYSSAVVQKLNTAVYEAVDILSYLGEVNAAIKVADATGVLSRYHTKPHLSHPQQKSA